MPSSDGMWRLWKSILFQVKYTNRNESNLIRTLFVANQRQTTTMYAFWLRAHLFYKRVGPQEKPCFFWIKSSAKRAFGGCLGSKRRWKTWYSAISHGELRISFDPWISEWGNPPDTLLLLYSPNRIAVDEPACWRSPPRLGTECVSNNEVNQVFLDWIHRFRKANPGNWNI
jgi:hypothetical protein